MADSKDLSQILLTNDDGAESEGIKALAAALVAAGLSVVVVAPAENQSGCGHFASFASPVRVERRPNLNGAVFYVCHGTPVDCVRAALIGDLAPEAKMVISGINRGCNFGDDTLGSGTFAGAAQGALLGIPALAVSQQSYPGHFSIFDTAEHSGSNFEGTAKVAAMFAHSFLRHSSPERAVLNLNLPAKLEESRVEITRAGRRLWARNSLKTVEYKGTSGYMTYGSREEPNATWQTLEFEPGTDFAAVRAGVGSVSPFTFDWNDPAPTQELRSWTDRVTEDVNRQLASAPVHVPRT